MKIKFLVTSLLIGTCIFMPFKNYALDEVSDEGVILYLGQVKMIPVNNPNRIVIGNPAIADVDNSSVTKKGITVVSKTAGTTTLVIWDSFGEHPYRIRVVSEDLREAKERIDNLLAILKFADVSTQLEEGEGKIILLGKVKNPQDREKISTALGSLKDKTIDLIDVVEEEAVVEIDVQVLEVNRDYTKTLGFTMPGSIGAGETPGRFPFALRQSMDAIFHVFDWPRNSYFTAQVDFLIQQGKAKVLSRPRLACQSGKEAELLIGGEKPIMTTQTVVSGGGLGSGTSVDYKEYGIKLKIKPTVVEDKKIKLGLNIEVSEVGAAETLTGSASSTVVARAYPLTKRNVSTELFLNDGQTLVIGGLIKQRTEEDSRKTAGLGDIPIIGMLFRKKTTHIGGGAGARGDIELLITLTPTLMKSGAAKEAKPSGLSEEKAVSPETANIPAPIAQYVGIIKERILSNLTYPASAKETGFQGTVKLKLHLSYIGELLEVLIKESSGYKILDDNAISVAKGVTSYPPFPPSIDQKDLWIEIPIAYRLD